MYPLPKVHEGFQYRLAGEVGSTKVMLTGKAESWKDRAKTLPEVTINATRPNSSASSTLLLSEYKMTAMRCFRAVGIRA